jgi:hypothetical protein
VSAELLLTAPAAEPVARTGDWKLVAPWWRWRAQGGEPRDTRPAFQKYDSGSFVGDFLANPQRCLVIDATHDRVQELVARPAPTLGGRLRVLATEELRPTSTLKLFLPTHRRFYLVVCELHCEKAGFPNAHAQEVCEAGFVVRRRRFDVGQGTVREARELIGRVEEAAALGASEPLDAARAELRLWASAANAGRLLEGWVVGADGVGRWQQVKERPGRLHEATFPLHALVPTPEATAHVGANRAIWFGTVPTSSSDHDAHGRARFDDTSIYEIRCYVRRHEPDEPKRPNARDCCGELTWSRPTERYQLASHFDLTGTANTQVTVQLPDIPRLKAQAASLPVGKGASVKLVAPAGSSMKVKSQSEGTLGGAQICSLSIPLVTIVAQFVFSIFMPIVIALFQLFALLRLKFCIPPSVSLNVAEMDALNVSLHGADAVDASAAAAAAVKVSLSASLGSDGAAADALAEYTPSAFADTVRTASRPAAAARAGAEIAPRIFEQELEPA